MRTKTQHTPGSWRTSRSGEVLAEAGGYICVCGNADKPATAVDRANARLIAAAPDLLDALRTFLAFYDDLSQSNRGFMGKLTLKNYAQWNEALLKAPAAIRKATR